MCGEILELVAQRCCGCPIPGTFNTFSLMRTIQDVKDRTAMKIFIKSVHHIFVHCQRVIQSPEAHTDMQNVRISHRQARERNAMRGSWRNYLRATGLSHPGTGSTYQGEMVHGGTLFKCEIPSVSGKGQNVNYRQQREGREGGWHVGKAEK